MILVAIRCQKLARRPIRQSKFMAANKYTFLFEYRTHPDKHSTSEAFQNS